MVLAHLANCDSAPSETTVVMVGLANIEDGIGTDISIMPSADGGVELDLIEEVSKK